jgi:hypothetical protein
MRKSATADQVDDLECVAWLENCRAPFIARQDAAIALDGYALRPGAKLIEKSQDV